MMNKLTQNNYYFILQKLNQYNINNPDDHIDAVNIISETLNISIDEIKKGINECQNKYDNYNYVDIFCEIQKNINKIQLKIKDNYIIELISQIEFYLSDSEKISFKIKQTNKKNKLLYLILELHKNQFFLETYLRALRDYL